MAAEVRMYTAMMTAVRGPGSEAVTSTAIPRWRVEQAGLCFL
jgi:hypothetical protein